MLACTKMACPPAEKCTPYSEPKMCIALAGVCYNAAKCDCTQDSFTKCLVDPCSSAECKDGYECVANYCGLRRVQPPVREECVDEAACACTEEGLRAAQREAGRTRQQDCGGLQHLQLLGRDARLHQDGVPSCREVHTVL
eukprot:TRINITY_DN10184_c0_g1_i15.p3 TRINITY_DN10184_c0_g1~~TRINITY_DN10184_c0_g1_i15.p3  ORF type:complete len:140 (+),score=29.87 TRINITY_DN10184_c0_g1_i15:122-541(+)